MVVGTDCHDVFLVTEFQELGQIKTESHYPVFITTNKLPIQVNIPRLTDTFKFYQYFLLGILGRDLKMLAIPRYSGTQVMDINLKSIILVKGMRQRNALPFYIIKC